MNSQLGTMFVACMNKCTPPHLKLTLDMPHHTIYECFATCGEKWREALKFNNFDHPEEFSHDIS